MAVIDNLVSAWELDEASGNRSDSHGSNTLTDTNTVGSTTGIISNAANFVGASSEYLTRASTDLGQTGDFAVEIWLNTTHDAAALTKGLIGKTAQFSIEHKQDNNTLFTVLDSVSGFSQANHATLINDGGWHQLICKYLQSDKKTRIALDGGAYTLAGGAVTNGPATGSSDFFLAATEASSFWTGAMDLVRIWTRDVTDAEKTWLYNAGAGRSYADIVAEGGPAGPVYLARPRWASVRR